MDMVCNEILCTIFFSGVSWLCMFVVQSENFKINKHVWSSFFFHSLIRLFTLFSAFLNFRFIWHKQTMFLLIFPFVILRLLLLLLIYLFAYFCLVGCLVVSTNLVLKNGRGIEKYQGGMKSKGKNQQYQKENEKEEEDDNDDEKSHKSDNIYFYVSFVTGHNSSSGGSGVNKHNVT